MKVTKEVIKITKLKELERNPRRISERKLKQLAKSVKDFSQMLDVREIVIDENNNILGGNQRYKALSDIGTDEVVVLRVTGLSDDKKDEFTIKDNIQNKGKAREYLKEFIEELHSLEDTNVLPTVSKIQPHTSGFWEKMKLEGLIQ